MKLSKIKALLPNLDTIVFELENGTKVPEHFHVTEVGVVTKHFIDCGGTVRNEKMANFQLWDANDYDHRLNPTRLLNIIQLSESKLNMEDLDIEVEYQGSNTIEKYDLDYNGKNFILVNKNTNCLAMDHCGIPSIDIKVEKESSSCCAPGGSCC